MPDGYGMYSTTTYASHGLNMANSAANWLKNLLDEYPGLMNILPDEWQGAVIAEGDDSGQLSSWVISGATVDNTDAGNLWYEFTDTAGTRKVEVFKDSAKASGDKVCSGTSVGDGSITLAEANSSGLSGSVTAAYTIADIDTGNLITVLNPEICLENLRTGYVFEEVVRQLLLNQHLPRMKTEYLKAIEDKDILKRAEILACIYRILDMQDNGDERRPAYKQSRKYHDMFLDAMKDPRLQIDQDQIESVTEADEQDMPADYQDVMYYS